VYTSFPSTVSNPTIFSGVGSGGRLYRGSFRFPIDELVALTGTVGITKIEFIGTVAQVINASEETWKVGVYRTTGQEDPEADAAQTEYDGCAVASPYATTTAFQQTGAYTVDLTSTAS